MKKELNGKTFKLYKNNKFKRAAAITTAIAGLGIVVTLAATSCQEENVEIKEVVVIDKPIEIPIEKEIISYTPEVIVEPNEIVNSDVYVSIVSKYPMKEIDGWMMTEDKMLLKKLFTENTQLNVTISYEDNEDYIIEDSNICVEVNNIDKTAPVCEVTYNNEKITNQNVVAKITSDKVMRELEGWTLSEDMLSQTKTYSKNTEETIVVMDLVGNETSVDVSIKNIDKTALTAEVAYELQADNTVKVIVTFNKNNIRGYNAEFLPNEEKKVFTKAYSKNGIWEETFLDLAGNEVVVPICVDMIVVYQPKPQNNTSTSTQPSTPSTPSTPTPPPEPPKEEQVEQGKPDGDNQTDSDDYIEEDEENWWAQAFMMYQCWLESHEQLSNEPVNDGFSKTYHI